MALSVVINQGGAAAGVAGQAREDLVTGAPVSLAAVGGPFSEYQWSLRHVAINIEAGTRASSTLTAPSASVTTLGPIDVPGTFAGRLAVNSGLGLGATPEDIFDWSFYAGTAGHPTKGPLASSPDELPRRPIAAGERGEHNVPDALDPTGNPDGWAREWERWKAVIRRLYTRQLFAVGVVTNSGAAALGRSLGLASATRNSVGRVTVAFSPAFLDGAYAAVALPIGTAGSASVVTRAGSGCVVERGDVGGTLVDADFVLLCALRF